MNPREIPDSDGTDAKSQQESLSRTFDIAVQHHGAGDLSKAKEIYRQILRVEPNQPVILNLLGVIAHQVGQNDEAEALITRALDIKPDFAEAHSNLGNALQNLGRLEDAVDRYRNAIGIMPDFAVAHSNLGNALKELGRLDEAVEHCRKALEIDPDFAEAHGNLGNALMALGRLDESLTCYRKALDIKPDFAEAFCNMGAALLKLGRLDEAVDHCRKALEINTDFAEAHSNLGNALKELKRPSEALASYRRAVNIKPDFAEAHDNLGVALMDSGQLEDAVSHCRKAIEINPNVAQAHGNLGHALQDLGRLDEALASYRTAAHISPDSAAAHCNLGVLQQQLGLLDEALASYQRTIDIEPNFADAHGNLGAVLQILGQLDAAVSHYRKAIEIKPDFAEAHFNLGNALHEFGISEEAVSCHRRAIELKPENNLFWDGLSSSLGSLSITSVDDELQQNFLDLLTKPTVAPAQLIRPVIDILRHHPEFAALLKAVTAGEQSSIPYPDAAKLLSAIPLLLKFMALSVINDLEVEKMHTRLRRSMILGLESENRTDNEACLPFSSALALHCFVNEYVFQETGEETAAVETLSKTITGSLARAETIPPVLFAALAAYRPLYRFVWARELLKRDWPDDLETVIDRQVREPLEEASLRAEIPSATLIQNNISQAVRLQYEENPYPRWIQARLPDKPNTIQGVLQASPLCLEPRDHVYPSNPEILVAGCGTGQQALYVASRFANATVLAADLSLSSLSYAVRKTRETELTNIEYAQADIMELGALGRQFDLIECIGVLHHLEDPLAGWRVLRGLLRPGGFMRIGLYSAAARRGIVKGRALIATQGYTTAPEDIRRFRKEIMTAASNGDRDMAGIIGFNDFFSLSECRDLLFHIQEHRYTVPEIDDALQELGLQFLGFSLRDRNALTQFKATHPEKASWASLAQWHEFEVKYPDTFRSLYVFWCQAI